MEASWKRVGAESSVKEPLPLLLITLDSQGQLAARLLKLGRAEEAEEMSRQLQEARKAKLGPDDSTS